MKYGVPCLNAQVIKSSLSRALHSRLRLSAGLLPAGGREDPACLAFALFAGFIWLGIGLANAPVLVSRCR